MHLIERKAHHRLFDMVSRRYVAVADVRASAESGADVVIVDGRSGRNVTREVLPGLRRRPSLLADLVRRSTHLVAWSLRQLTDSAIHALQLPLASDVRKVGAKLRRLESRLHRIRRRPRRRS